MAKLLSTIACNLDADILGACLPLLQEEKVAAIEWSFDALYQLPEIPHWFDALLHAFSSNRRLIGHGVFFSLFSGKWRPEQTAWLVYLKKICRQYQFDHITEHFGFMTGNNFHHGAPLSIPYSSAALAIGRDRLKRIADACQCPVGLENLAFSYSIDDVRRHGDFLQELMEPVNGFIILDLHNLYCQAHNFGLPIHELMQAYPLQKVRELHISGGSWNSNENAPNKKVRRDTHDDAVPTEVFAALQTAINLCPHVKFVVMEQLGNALHTAPQRKQFYADFVAMEAIVQAANKELTTEPIQDFMPGFPLHTGAIAEDEQLYLQQLELSTILETATSEAAAISALQSSSLAGTAWGIESWQPYMIETARQIAQKWKKEPS